jgi:hypothetical protein
MKKILALTAVTFSYFCSQGQGLIINLKSGYGFGCTFEAYNDTSNYYTDSISGGIKYGLDVGYQVDRNFSAELTLMYQNTTMPVWGKYNGTDISQRVNIQLLWIMVGGTSYFPANRVEFLLGTHVGAGVYHLKDLAAASHKYPLRFAWEVNGGMAYFFSKNVGINVKGEASFSTDPLNQQFATPGLSNHKSGFSYFFQFGLSGGFIIRFFRFPDKSKRK